MKRIQLKRTRGWRKPPTTITVTRPSRWGNPFRLNADIIQIDAEHRRKHLCKWVPMGVGDIDKVVTLYKGLLTWSDSEAAKYLVENGLDGATSDFYWWKAFLERQNLNELKGKDLACWCRPDSPCHADVLLVLANTPDQLKLEDLNAKLHQS